MQDIDIPVPWGKITGRVSGPEEGPILILLHGWMNNCATFSGLQPLLPAQYRCISIDLPGHGCSSHLPAGSTYGLLQYAVCVHAVCERLGCERVSLLGHSMGAAVSLLYSALFPDRVRRLVLIDLPKPLTVSAAESCRWAHQGSVETVRHWFQPANHEPRPLAQLRSRLMTVLPGVSEEAAEALLLRGVVPHDGTELYRWSHDVAVRYRSIAPFIFSTLQGYIEQLRCRLLVVNAERGVVGSLDQEEVQTCYQVYARVCAEFVKVQVPGSHFVHLSHPDRVAPPVNQFLNGEVVCGDSSKL